MEIFSYFQAAKYAFAIPFIFIAVDILTGFINAWSKKQFESAIMREGLGKKAGEIIAVIIGELVTYILGIPAYIVDGIIFYISFMELMSILENLDKLGVKLPKKLKDRLNNVDPEELIEREKTNEIDNEQ